MCSYALVVQGSSRCTFSTGRRGNWRTEGSDLAETGMQPPKEKKTRDHIVPVDCAQQANKGFGYHYQAASICITRGELE